jgi:hypothetical protein
MKFKELEKDVYITVNKKIFRKWWQFWKPKLVNTEIQQVFFPKGSNYMDCENKSIEESYNEINEIINND